MTDEAGHKQAIAARFGARAQDYDAHAGLQRRIAGRLVSFLPTLQAPDILEVGCGTGFLTGQLFQRYESARFLITDLSSEMVALCSQLQPGRAEFRVMDAEAPDCEGHFDLIATSMTLQWFLDPVAGLARLRNRLKPGGALYYATLGEGSFAEWRSVLATEGLADGTVAMPSLPGVFEEDRETVSYGSAADFLAAMKAIGAGEARRGYRAMAPGYLRRALRRLERDHAARITWHIVYGRIERPD